MTLIDIVAKPVDFAGVNTGWSNAMAQLAGLLRAKNVHPSRAVVLLPYAQLMQEARLAWAAHTHLAGQPSAFVPRFETTMNWVDGAAAVATQSAASSQDIQMDAALDVLTAASLLQRAGLAAQQHVLAGRLVEAAWSLARVAAAQTPALRLAWGADKAQDLALGMESDALAFELAIARIALAWAAASSYPTDVLFSAEVKADLDLLLVIDGFQSEPLTEALKSHFAESVASIPLKTPDLQGAVALHTAQDLEDEAHLAAACVLAHLRAGRSPVALIAQDRVLTRRVRAMLAEKGVTLRDETGWKLSTTRAAATLMGLLSALAWDASTDSVLDWLKNAPAFDAADVTRAETVLRKIGRRSWRTVPANHQDIAPMAAQVAALRTPLQAARSLADWLGAMHGALQDTAQWDALAGDAAGMAVIAALHMTESNDLTETGNPRMSLQDFTSWVNQTLEAASFAPTHPPKAQVVILPLSQLLGRAMQAVVLPGCDEARLPVSPEPSGQWTPAQRALLGLATRQQLDRAQRAAWCYALTAPSVDVLWRVSEGGERLMPSGFVQALLLVSPELTADPRPIRAVLVQPSPKPMPTGHALPVTKLSASAYEDLRRCPYRFFALRQLKLQEPEELESELGKRDFGNWLHWLLNRFHEALKVAPTQEIQAQEAMINIAADEATLALGLTPDEFLPFAAIWPRVRDGYLDWLAKHQATGASYLEGEVWKDMPLGPLTLVGKIDRVDQMPDGSHWVMDYKTEARSTTESRIKDAGEDTQLAFYAALLHDDTLAAAYVNLGEKEATKTYAQDEIVARRDDLIGGILSDMQRIADGVPLPALGEGKACDFCTARGLCRKDFWTV
jgi:ATP-dependent helicase/nuclease subunit B